MKSTDEVEWLTRCKKAKKLVMLVTWNESYRNAHSSFKQKITVTTSPKSTAGSRSLEVMPGRRLDRRWEVEPAQSECPSGKTSWRLASVHVLPAAPATKPGPLKSSLLLPSGQSVFWLLAVAGKDDSRWPSHCHSVQGEVDSDQHVAAWGPVSRPRPEMWVQHQCGKLFQFGSEVLSSTLAHTSILR